MHITPLLGGASMIALFGQPALVVAGFRLVGVGITINTEGKLTLLQTIVNTGIIIEVFADTETVAGKVMNAVGAWIKAVLTALTSE